MTRKESFRALARAIRETGWAPLTVLVVSFPVAQTAFAESVYPLLHLLGGAALAYFFRRAVRLVHHAWPPVLSSIVALSLACTAALAWEFAEFAVDFFFRTTLQEGLLDTMTDLILAATGAAAWLALRRCPFPWLSPSGRRSQTPGRRSEAQRAKYRTAP
jgi:hypothetical protein